MRAAKVRSHRVQSLLPELLRLLGATQSCERTFHGDEIEYFWGKALAGLSPAPASRGYPLELSHNERSRW